MQLRPFPWPWSGPECRRLTRAAFLWIALLLAWGFVQHNLVPGAAPAPWQPGIAAEAPLYARFDTGWYRDIARDGYGPPPPPGRESEHAFFPLYPYLARAIHVATGLGVFRSLLLVAWASFFLALPLFLEEARRRGVPEDPWRALPFLLLYPSAFFLQSAYSDAVFFLVALLAFRALRSGSVAAPSSSASSPASAGPPRPRSVRPSRWRGGSRRTGRPSVGDSGRSLRPRSSASRPSPGPSRTCSESAS